MPVSMSWIYSDCIFMIFAAGKISQDLEKCSSHLIVSRFRNCLKKITGEPFTSRVGVAVMVAVSMLKRCENRVFPHSLDLRRTTMLDHLLSTL